MRAFIPILFLWPLAQLAASCKGEPNVVGFPDAGDPCSHGMNIDCGEFAGTTCTVDAGRGCERVTFGCSPDASFFTSVDMSQCPPEAGPEAAPPGDGGLIHEASSDAAEAGARDGGDGAAPDGADAAGE